MKTLKKTFLFSLIAIVILGASSSLAVFGGTTASTEASIDFAPGTLDLNTAPNLVFGNYTIDGVTTVFTKPNMALAQVTDARGSGAGWNLTVALSQFEKGGTPALPGAVIKLKGGTAAGTATAPTIPAEITINPDSTAVTDATAAINSGRGSWDLSWAGASGAEISIPVIEQNTGSYSATLSWVLSDTP